MNKAAGAGFHPISLLRPRPGHSIPASKTKGTTMWGSILAALLLAAPAAADPPIRAQSVQPLPSLFSARDYPAEAVRNREEGSVGFRIEVGADGRPSGCSIAASSGSALLDATTCRLLMERARFRPARDSRGKPTSDSFNGRIIWRMPPVQPRLETAQRLWNTCVQGEASKLAPGGLAAPEVVRRSFPPCAALEAIVAQEAEESVPLTEPRAELARQIEEALPRIRAELTAPAADPPRP